MVSYAETATRRAMPGPRHRLSYTRRVSLRVVALAESDSYLKWAVTLLGTLPGDTRVDVVLACSPIRPSASQQAAALAGTAFAGRRLDVVSPGRLLRLVDRERPDAVLIACAGPSAHAYSDALSRSPHRPVLLAGIPGIALPARRRAWSYRGAIDMLVVHSHREVAEYDAVRVAAGAEARIGLATIPFLAAHPELPLAGDADPLVAAEPEPTARSGVRGNRVIFATQGKVPVDRANRVAILRALDRLAAARPDLRVVVKTRGQRGEFHTHYEPHHYEDLWASLVASGQVGDAGSLEFAGGSMAEQLETAAALVTVSSTAVLEAMARNLPVLLIDEFGVDERLLNQVFEGSGCLGGLAALEAADFRHPAPRWLLDNYFHSTAENDWIPMLGELVGLARKGELPPLADGLDPGRTRRRRRRDRWRLTPVGSAFARSRQRIRIRRLQRLVGEESALSPGAA